MRLPPLAVAAVLAGLLLAACLERNQVETQDVVSTIPWPDREEAAYVVLNEDGVEMGRGVLAIARKDGQFELQLNFRGEDGTDETSVLVDAQTLRPDFLRRERRLEETEIVEAQYRPEDEVVDIVTMIEDEERTVPLRLDRTHYYDNDTSLFVWRTIPFDEGYRASYHTVLTNVRDIQLLTLEVREKEEVTVPAGTFQAWRVEIRSEGVRQTAWYTDTPERLLVQYDNSLQLFQLLAKDGAERRTPQIRRNNAATAVRTSQNA